MGKEEQFCDENWRKRASKKERREKNIKSARVSERGPERERKLRAKEVDAYANSLCQQLVEQI